MDKQNGEYCTLYIIRHGETEWNVKNLLQGHLDSPLTETGVAQAKMRAEALAGVHFDAIFSSDSMRAHRTAEIIKLDRDILVQTSKLLRESNLGKFQGMEIGAFREQLKDKMAERQRLSDAERWEFKIHDEVETDGELVSRLLVQLREIALTYPGKTVAVVTHGGCLQNLLIKLGYATHVDFLQMKIDNAACVKVLSDGIDFFVKETWGVRRS